VREALRDAVAAFGTVGGEVALASPATGEAIFAAVQRRLAPPGQARPVGGRFDRASGRRARPTAGPTP